MRRLICAFVVRIWQRQLSSWRGSNGMCPVMSQSACKSVKSDESCCYPLMMKLLVFPKNGHWGLCLDWMDLTTNFRTVATFHFHCKFPNFPFCLNQPHQRKWKYFHPLGIFSFKSFVSCQFTYWRPTHYLNNPFSITKQLCHWQLRHHTSDLASPAVSFLLKTCPLSQWSIQYHTTFVSLAVKASYIRSCITSCQFTYSGSKLEADWGEILTLME